MEIITKAGKEDLATVYIGKFDDGRLIEFAESVETGIPKSEKWVLIVSTLFGCPVKCKFCDCSEFSFEKLTKNQILEQILFLVDKYYSDRIVLVNKFKIQFARIGEPTFNPAVLDVLEELPAILNAPGLMPSISTIAPKGSENFLNKLKIIKDKLYKNKFQMQFSIHSTNEQQRDWLIPVKKLSLHEINNFGDKFYSPGDRKITLNFALSSENDFDSKIILNTFNPDKFLVKITPVNPTYKAIENNISSYDENDSHLQFEIDNLRKKGFEVIISIGELEENQIGSNCGQHILSYMKNNKSENFESYTYNLEPEISNENRIFQRQ